MQTNAHTSPNSAAVPKRPAGFWAWRSRATCSTGLPVALAWDSMLERRRSVSKGPGRMLLIVTLWATVLRLSPAIKPVSPARAPLDRPRLSMGDFTETDVMLTMRPNFRAIIPSTVALIRKIGVSMLASRARSHTSRSHWRKSPGGGPPALLTRMSGAGHAWSSAARTASVVMSPATVVTRTPVASRISFAAASSASFVRAFIVMFTPSRASDMAQPLPSPLLAAQTIAFLPLIPRSMVASFLSGGARALAPLGGQARGRERPADRFSLRAADRRQRRPDVCRRDPSEEDERFLHPVVHVHEGRRVEDGHERRQPVVDPTGAIQIALAARLEQLGLQIRGDAAHSGDRAIGAQQEGRH